MKQDDDSAARKQAAAEASGASAWNFCTSLLQSEGKGTPFRYCGSATFVQVGGHRCLLTAAHVWELFVGQDESKLVVEDIHGQIGLALDDGRSLTVHRGAMKVLYASPKPADDWGEWGPDIALVDLGQYGPRLEAAGKAFYDLSKRRDEFLASSLNVGAGPWLTVGVPRAFAKWQGRQPDGADRTFMERSVLTGPLWQVDAHAGFDYVQLGLLPKIRPELFPEEWGGMSGAGVWQIRDPDAVVLEGVVFWQYLAPEIEFLRGHGRRTIYEFLMSQPGVA